MLDDEVLDVLLTVGVACLVDEPDEPQAATDTQRSTMAPTAAQRRGKLMTTPSVPSNAVALEQGAPGT